MYCKYMQSGPLQGMLAYGDNFAAKLVHLFLEFWCGFVSIFYIKWCFDRINLLLLQAEEAFKQSINLSATGYFR